MKYFGKLIMMSGLCLLVAGLVVLTNGNMKLNFGKNRQSDVAIETESRNVQPPGGYEEEKPVLILYSPGNEYSVKYAENLADTLTYLKRTYELLDIGRTDSVSYHSYSMVILASQNLETELKDGAKRLFTYVEEGGGLFWGILQDEVGSEFQSIYKRLGVMDYEDYVEYKGVSYEKDLIPGMAGQSFEADDMEDVSLWVRLVEEAEVYANAQVNGHQVPLIWSYSHGQGKISCYNGTAIAGDFYRGIAAGCINLLYEDVMYPIINAKCIFIDDFPSPQYESTSDVVRREYNKSVKEFYRDIWWPDMQKAANKYGYKYTGLFVATYNDIVNPENFEFSETSMEQYYGNSLLRAGHEMGAHGYNHQSLAEENQVPEDMGYNAWADVQDMEASLTELVDITAKLFPGTLLKTYVPPSNYLSALGREAVKNALPDVAIISGVYTKEGEEGAVYCQRFETAPDGIAEFPRVTSGMMPEDFDRMEWLSGLGLHGVFSHFIHPDDIFDEERGKGQNWETLIESYEGLLAGVKEAASSLRSLTASDAADALRVYESAAPRLVYGEKQIQGSVDGFLGDTFFFLRTEKKPEAADDACLLSPVGKDGTYYLVTVRRPEFTILLKGE